MNTEVSKASRSDPGSANKTFKITFNDGTTLNVANVRDVDILESGFFRFGSGRGSVAIVNSANVLHIFDVAYLPTP